MGLVVGLLLIGVGVLRAGLFLLTGGHLAALSADDVRLVVYYLGGFGLAGAVVGPLIPRMRTRVGTYVVFSFAGMIVMAAIMASDNGGLRRQALVDWLWMMPLGAAFGCAFAYGFSRKA